MHTIVLHHGLFGFGQIRLGRLRFCYFRGIDRALMRAGHRLIIPSVHPTGSITRRAAQLKEAILRQLPLVGGQRVVIIAHSLGGLDARHMISRLGMADRVAALVTICTPHHGSPYADWCVRHIGQKLRAFHLMDHLGVDVGAIRDLTTDACARFNEQTPDAPGVGYYSVAAACPWQRMAPQFLLSQPIVRKAEGENDGLVSVSSARWGTLIEVWPVDHLAAINHRISHNSAEISRRYVAITSGTLPPMPPSAP